MFCQSFGCEYGETERDDQKWKRTTNAKYYTTPWRTDNFSSHLKKQHASLWEEYQVLSTAQKTAFFSKNESPESVNMRSFVQPEGSMKARIIAKQKCKYIIDADVVNDLIGELLFDDSEDGGSEDYDPGRAKKAALKIFVLNPEDNVYVADVKSVLQMNLVVRFVAVGVSFCQASRLYRSVKEETGMGVLGPSVMQWLPNIVDLCALSTYKASRRFSRTSGHSVSHWMPEIMLAQLIST